MRHEQNYQHRSVLTEKAHQLALTELNSRLHIEHDSNRKHTDTAMKTSPQTQSALGTLAFAAVAARATPLFSAGAAIIAE